MAAIAGGAKSAEWITPEQQLQRLGQDEEGVIKEVVGTKQRPGLPVVLATIVAKYALSPNLTKWHRALKNLSILPDAIPPLPFEVSDTESFYLRPPLSVNEMAAIVNAYGEAHLGVAHPLKFRLFWDATREEHADVRPREWQWISLTNDVLEGSRGRYYSEQAELVAGLGANYEIPTLLDVITVVFFDKIVDENTLFPAGNEQNQYCDTYTRVREKAQKCRLVVGGFAPGGLVVDGCNFAYVSIGVAALRK